MVLLEKMCADDERLFPFCVSCEMAETTLKLDPITHSTTCLVKIVRAMKNQVLRKNWAIP